jgi:periplasmic divalent cation tolerance protein
MTKQTYCQLQLTCKDKSEADKIANTLLAKHLVACVRQMSVGSDYWWQDKIEHSDEILLMMESRMDLFGEAEKEVAKLHSYETFVLEASGIDKISKKAEMWLKKELKNGTR